MPRLVASLSLIAVLIGVPAYAASAASPAPSPASSEAAAAAKVVTFGVQPAIEKNNNPRSFFSWVATPGGHLTDTAAALNFSYKPIRLTVGVTDAVNTGSGGFALLRDTDKPKDVGSWITLNPRLRSVLVPGRTATAPGRVLLPLSLVVPDNAEPGDHVGGITVSLISTVKSSTGQNFKLVQRVGSRIFLRVSGPLHPGLTIDSLKASYSGVLNPIGTGVAHVSYRVRNTGNVSLGGQQSIRVTGLFGTHASSSKLPQIPLLLPGSAITVRADVKGVFPTVREKATVTITAMTVAGSNIPPTGPWTASTRFWAIPWMLIACVAFVLLLLGAYGWWRRRRRNRTSGPGSEERPAPDSPDQPDLNDSLLVPTTEDVR